jgi:FkbM family methyltransferase
MLQYIFKCLSRLLSGHGLGRSPIVANMYLKLAKRLLPDVITFRGHKIYLDSPDSMRLSINGQYCEEYELSLFESEIDQRSIVLDIGANIGLYTLIAAKHAEKVYSFEPDRISFLNLKKNVEANTCKNVLLVNKAVSDKTGRAPFSSYSKYPLDRGIVHLVTKSDETHQPYTIVDTVTLDEFFIDKPNKIDIVKMDVEGLEFEALKGMRNLINTNKCIKFFLEFNPYTLTRHGTDLDLFLDYLSSVCSQIYYIDEINMTKKPVTKKWLLNFAIDRSDGHHINLLAERNTG